MASGSQKNNRENMIEEAYSHLPEHIYRVADKVIDYHTGEARKEMLEACRQAMFNALDLDLEYRHKLELLVKTNDELGVEENTRTAKEIFAELLEAKPVPRKDHKKHASLKTLNKIIQDAEKRVPREAAEGGNTTEESDNEGAGGSLDETVVMTQMQMSTLDPFTQREIADPVMSAKCKHSFDRETITEMLKRSPKVQCPAPGCGWIVAKDIVPNMEMKRFIEERNTKAKKKSKKRR